MAQGKTSKLTDYLSEDQMREYASVFKLFKQEKQDNLSKLTRNELSIAMRMLGLNPREEDIMHIMNTVDVEEGGYVEFQNFVQMMEHQRVPDEEEALRLAFNVFDADQRGFIESDELKDVMESIEITNEEDGQEMLRDLGLDQNRRITYEEFKSFITAHNDSLDAEDRADPHQLSTSV